MQQVSTVSRVDSTEQLNGESIAHVGPARETSSNRLGETASASAVEARKRMAGIIIGREERGKNQ